MMCCYHPTATVFIDDDVNFLNALAKYSGIDNCITYSSPKRAIEFVLNSIEKPIQQLGSHVTLNPSSVENVETLPEDHIISFKIRNLHKEIYDIRRFKEVSVIIVDYYMDEMDGIALCEQLAAHPAKKILLTGGIDTDNIAINAFNNGLIHRFINKSDKHFLSKFTQAIDLLKESYFKELSLKIFPHLTIPSAALYQNSLYNNFLSSLRDQYQAIEYYLLDTSGTSLILDMQGEPTWCIVKQELDMQHYEQLAYEQEAPSSLIQSLHERSLIPFFLSDDDYQKPVTEWGQYCYPAKPLPGFENYYYSVSKGNQGNHIQKDQIKSYLSYLQLQVLSA